MRSLRDRIRRVAPHPLSVLLEGETGTGKELVARALHAQSPRRGGPFVAVNCAAIPEHLAESHLFGHEAGAFTGARGQQRGVMEQASGGTLFLDELAELPLPIQAKLLRALQEREVVRVGSQRAGRPIPIDIRVVAASHRDLVASCAEGRFREDLYYRLREYRIRLPPLRERDHDAVELARHFLSNVRGPRVRLGRDAQDLLLSHSWPGNVRELRAAVLAARVDARGGRIGAADLAEHLAIPGGRKGDSAVAPSTAAPVADRSAQVLAELRGNGPTSISTLQEATAVPKSSLRRILALLEDEGSVVHEGEGRSRRYKAVSMGGGERRTAATEGALPAERHAAVIDYLRRRGIVTRREYVELTGVSPRTANRDLEELARTGVIRANGRKGRAVGYVLVAAPGERGG